MSKLGILKKQWDYEPNVPCCSECVHFRQAFIKLTTNSNTKRINQHCHLGGFTVSRNGVCKNWTGKDGSKLEAA
jgi:hypothetical protein